MKFKKNDRVTVYGTDEATKYFSLDKYEMTGTVLIVGAWGRDYLYKVELDNTASQDSEGHNAINIYHEKQMRKINGKV